MRTTSKDHRIIPIKSKAYSLMYQRQMMIIGGLSLLIGGVS